MLTSLRDKTQELVYNRPRHMTYEVIKKETGIPVGWITKFAAGKFPDPGVNRVETLYSYLSGRAVISE